MAEFSVCCSWMLDNEDAGRTYATVPDVGGRAISGINSASFPREFAFIESISQAQRGPSIESFYQRNFWNKWFDQLTDNELAKRVFDAAVNMGPGTAVKLLQQSLGIHADGCWGPITVSEANSETNAVQGFKAARTLHYKEIVASNPQDEKYLSVWMARSTK